MELSNQLIAILAKVLKDGRNQTDSLAILILIHLVNALNSVVIDKDGYFFYEFRQLETVFDSTHKVIRDRLDSLQTAGLIQFVSKTKSSLRIKIEFEQLESLLAENSPARDSIHISNENSFLPSRNVCSPARDMINALEVANSNNISISKNDYYDDDENANLTRTESNTDVADAITKILSIIQISKSALKEDTFKRVVRLFNQDINLFFDESGAKIEFASTSFNADEFLRSISTLTPERIVEVLNRVEAQHIQANWSCYTLTSLFKESEKKYIPRIKNTEKHDNEKRSSSNKLGYTNKTQYDFAALQKYINEN